MGATRHWPAPSFTDDSSTPGIHAPVTRVAIDPLPIAFNQSSLQPGTVESSLPSTSLSQVAVHFFVPSSCRFIETFVPSTLNGRPPACQIMEVVKPESPESLVMYAFGSAACSFC